MRMHSSSLTGLLRREWLLAIRHKGEYFQALAFFLLIASLFALVLETELLAQTAAVVIWISALMASLLCADILFRNDQADGTLEQLLLLGKPLYLAVLVKVLVHWLLSGVPLLLLAQLLGVLLHLPEEAFLALLLSLLLGTPMLSLTGAIGAALTVTVRSAGMLIALLVLPLYVPVLLLAVQTIENAVLGEPISGTLWWLSALLALNLTLAPFAIAGGLKAVHFS